MRGEQRLFYGFDECADEAEHADSIHDSPSELLTHTLHEYLSETGTIARSRLLRIGNTCFRALGAQAPEIATTDLINFAALNNTNGLIDEALEAAEKSLANCKSKDQTEVHRLCTSVGLLAMATGRRRVIPTYVRAHALYNLIDDTSGSDFNSGIALMVALQNVTEGPTGIIDQMYLNKIYTLHRDTLVSSGLLDNSAGVMDPDVAVLLALETARTRNQSDLKRNTLSQGVFTFPRLEL